MYQLLASLSSFKGLPETELQNVAEITHRGPIVERDGVIIEKGSVADRLLIVHQGLCKVVTSSPQGKEATLDLFGPGALLGEVAIFDGGARSARVIAIERTQLLQIGKSQFIYSLPACPALTLRLLETGARRLRSLTIRHEHSNEMGVLPLLAQKLAELAERFGTPQTDGALRIEIRLTQTDLGTMIGSSRERVNKCIGYLSKQGTIRRAERHIEVLDLPGLHAVSRTSLAPEHADGQATSPRELSIRA